MSYPRREYQVQAFHEATKRGAVTSLAEVTDLRVALLKEEAAEVIEAIIDYSYFKHKNREHLLKELCDLQYVLSGIILAFKLADVFEEAFSRVHKSNMEKVEAGVQRMASGKILKPMGWQKPDLSDLV